MSECWNRISLLENQLNKQNELIHENRSIINICNNTNNKRIANQKRNDQIKKGSTIGGDWVYTINLCMRNNDLMVYQNFTLYNLHAKGSAMVCLLNNIKMIKIKNIKPRINIDINNDMSKSYVDIKVEGLNTFKKSVLKWFLCSKYGDSNTYANINTCYTKYMREGLYFTVIYWSTTIKKWKLKSYAYNSISGTGLNPDAKTPIYIISKHQMNKLSTTHPNFKKQCTKKYQFLYKCNYTNFPPIINDRDRRRRRHRDRGHMTPNINTNDNNALIQSPQQFIFTGEPLSHF
eukprot:503485_1